MAKTQDIYVKLRGYDSPDQAGTDISLSPEAAAFVQKVNGTAGYLDTHHPLLTVWFRGGQGTESPVAPITIRLLMFAKHLGRILISGGSAGGKNVLQVAGRLFAAHVPVRYLAIWDGAFQKDDLLDPSTFDDDANFKSESPATLKFKGTPVQCEKINFFQSWGHTLDKNQEIHGEVDGFPNVDLTKSDPVQQVKRTYEANVIKLGRDKQKAIADAHVAAYGQGIKKAEDRVYEILTTE